MTRVVIVGHGMAGSRFVQELRARDQQRRLQVTVVGAEPDGAYNRVLLSSVLAGSLTPADVEMVPPAWYAEQAVDLRLGVEVEHIDRRRRRVLTSQGEYLGYDYLVLATGSRAWVPPIEGIVSGLVDGVVGGDELDRDVAVFRTLEDFRRIAGLLEQPSRRTRNEGDGERDHELSHVQRAVVLGGGLLGLEAARGLAGRGIEVEVIHPMDRLMERQLDAEAGQVLAQTLRALGVQVRLGAQARTFDELAGQRVLVLDDGTRVAADLLIVACGVRPNTRLARAAKLEVDRAIVVDERLTSVSDPRIHAIGECAQHDGQVYGLVAPAWEQAGVLADVLTGGNAAYHGTPMVTRLKAADVDLAAMGEADVELPAGPASDGLEVLRFADPARGLYQKVVIRDGRLTGAIMLGGAETVGTVTQLFDRASPVPADRRALIFPGVADAAAMVDPATLPDDALVCRCNNVTAGVVREACGGGAATVAEVAMCTRATTGCGGCREDVARIMAVQPDPMEDDGTGAELVEVPA